MSVFLSNSSMHMLTDLELCIHAIFDLDKVDNMSDDQNSLFKFIIPMLNARRLLVQVLQY